MTPEERQMLAGLFERVAATASTPRENIASANSTPAHTSVISRESRVRILFEISGYRGR